MDSLRNSYSGDKTSPLAPKIGGPLYERGNRSRHHDSTPPSRTASSLKGSPAETGALPRRPGPWITPPPFAAIKAKRPAPAREPLQGGDDGRPARARKRIRKGKTTMAQARTPEQLLEILTSLAIPHKNHEHPPVFTVEEASHYRDRIPGAHCKNLFLRDRKKRLHLVVTLADKPLNLKELGGQIDAKGLHFGKPELLEAVLGVTPGSVTPFGVINAVDHDITVVLDEEMLDEETLNFHPLTNSATTTLSADDLLRFVRHCGKEPRVIRL